MARAPLQSRTARLAKRTAPLRPAMLPLTLEQTTALAIYARQHGRSWKAELRREWMEATALPVLHLLRNTHGPSWLAGYRLPGS